MVEKYNGRLEVEVCVLESRSIDKYKQNSTWPNPIWYQAIIFMYSRYYSGYRSIDVSGIKMQLITCTWFYRNRRLSLIMKWVFGRWSGYLGLHGCRLLLKISRFWEWAESTEEICRLFLITVTRKTNLIGIRLCDYGKMSNWRTDLLTINNWPWVEFLWCCIIREGGGGEGKNDKVTWREAVCVLWKFPDQWPH